MTAEEYEKRMKKFRENRNTTAQPTLPKESAPVQKPNISINEVPKLNISDFSVLKGKNSNIQQSSSTLSNKIGTIANNALSSKPAKVANTVAAGLAQVSTGAATGLEGAMGNITLPTATQTLTTAPKQTLGSQVSNFFKVTLPNTVENTINKAKEPFTGPSLSQVMTEAKISPKMLVEDSKLQMAKENPTRDDYSLVKQTQEAINKYGLPTSPIKAITEDTSNLQNQLKSATDTWQVSPVKAATANVAAVGSGIFGNTASFFNSLGAQYIPVVKDINNALISTQEVLGENAQKYNKGSYGEALGAVTQGLTSVAPYIVLGTGKAIQGGSKIATTALNLMRNPSFWYSLSNMWGQKYQEAKNNGASEGKALANAVLYALPSALVEVSGGIGSQGKEVQSLLKTMGEEVAEEITQDIIGGISDKITTNPKLPVFSTTENAILNPINELKTALYTAPVAGIAGGTGKLNTNLIANKTGTNINTLVLPEMDLATQSQLNNLNNPNLRTEILPTMDTKTQNQVNNLLKNVKTLPTANQVTENVKTNVQVSPTTVSNAQGNIISPTVKENVFNKNVDDFVKGIFNKNNHITVLNESPSILQKLGAKNLPITVTPNKLERIIYETGKQNKTYHGLGAELTKQIPQALQNPLNILKSHDNSYVFITELAGKQGRPVIASIKIDGEGKINDIDIKSNVMASVYGRNNYDTYMKDNINKGNMVYDIDEGIIKENLSDSQGLQLSNANPKISKNSINQNDSSVNTQYSQNIKNDTADTQPAFSLSKNEIKENSKYKSKSEQYQTKEINNFVEGVSKSLGISKFADKTSLKNTINDFAEQSKTGVTSEQKQTLINNIIEQGIIVDDAFYNENKDIKSYIQKTPIYVSEQISKSITDFNDFRKSNMGNLRLTNDVNATKIDTIYAELSAMNSTLFPNDITNQEDQLKHISEIQKNITKVETELKQYAENNEEYKSWASNEIERRIEPLIQSMKQVDKYQQEKAIKAEQKESNKKLVKNTTIEEVAELYNMRKEYQKTADKTMKNTLLTDKEKIQVDRLLKGDITLDQIPIGYNKAEINKAYKAKFELNEINKLISEYNSTIRANRNERARELTANSATWKDKKIGLLYARETQERNIKDIAGEKDAKPIEEAYFRPIHTNEALATKFKNDIRNKVRALNLADKAEYEATYSDDLGEHTEKVSENGLVQLLGEGKISLEQVNKIGADGQKIVNAVNEFRDIYDNILKKANESLIRNGYAPVDYKKNYFPHFTETEPENVIQKIASKLGMNVDTQELPTDIAGITHTFRPGKKWVGNFLKRSQDVSVYDAKKGLDNYLEGIADVIYHTDDIQNLRAFENAIRYQHSDEGIKSQIDDIIQNDTLASELKQSMIDQTYSTSNNPLSHYVTDLRSYTDNLAGKKSLDDRRIEHNLGRGIYNIANSVQNRVAANMVGANISSALTNFIPLTQLTGVVDTKNILEAVWDTTKGAAKSDGIIDKSEFLTNRIGSQPIIKTTTEKIADKLDLMNPIDRFTAEAVVRARYYQNIQNGMSEYDAMDEADKLAAKLIASRSKGSLPTLFNQKSAKLFTAFQLEANNQLSWYFKDVPDELKKKGIAALASAFVKMFIGTYLYNELYEKLTGRRAAFDPIDIVKETIGDFADESKTKWESTAKFGKNVAEELPFVSGLVGGGRLPISSALPNITNVGKAGMGLATGEMDTKKALSTLGKEFAKPVFYFLPPFGGGQAKKTIEGLSTFLKGGSYGVSSKGKETLQYPVKQNIPNAIRSTLFGKYSTEGAKKYLDNLK